MKRTLALGAALLVAASLMVTVLYRDSLSPGPAYTVPQVLTMLARHRSAWAGKRIRVVGVWSVCTYGFCPNEAYLGNRMVYLYGGLAVGYGPTDPWSALVRRIPLIGNLVGSDPQPIENAAAIYDLELLKQPSCFTLAGSQAKVCYDARLLGVHRINAIPPGMGPPYGTPYPSMAR